MSAQDTTRASRLDTITVTAERRPTTANGTTATVRVIDALTIQAKGAVDLPTLLREIPGLQLDPVVGSGNGISMQGLGSDRVLVLLDGVPIEGRLNNEFDLTRIDPSQLERIEIVEGPQSTLYGSSALGGVINLITRAPNGRRVEMSTNGGTYGQVDLAGRISGTAGNTGFALDAGHRHIDVPPGTSAGTPGSAERWDFLGNIVRQVGAALVTVRALHVRENQDYQAAAGPFTAQNVNQNFQTDVLATAGFHDDATELRVHASVYDHTLDETVGTGPTSSDPQQQRLMDVEVIRRGHFASSDWVLGVRGEHETITSTRLADPEETNTLGAVYGSAEWKLASSLSLATGARATVSQRWGSDLAPRLGLVWHDTKGVYAKAGVAHGFRAPSFSEQFSNFTNVEAFYAVIGNPDLKPETSWNLTGEVGVRTKHASAYVRGFGNRLRNFIEADFVGVDGQIAQFTYNNVERAHTVGGEVGGSVTRGIVTLEGSYAYLDAKDDSTDQPLLGRAKNTVRGAITMAHAHWSVTAEGVRASRFPLSQDPETNAILFEGASPRVNLRGGLDVAATWRAEAGVDNVGDVIPENAIAGFGRRWFAGLTWRGGW